MENFEGSTKRWSIWGCQKRLITPPVFLSVKIYKTQGSKYPETGADYFVQLLSNLQPVSKANSPSFGIFQLNYMWKITQIAYVTGFSTTWLIGEEIDIFFISPCMIKTMKSRYTDMCKFNFKKNSVILTWKLILSIKKGIRHKKNLLCPTLALLFQEATKSEWWFLHRLDSLSSHRSIKKVNNSSAELIFLGISWNLSNFVCMPDCRMHFCLRREYDGHNLQCCERKKL
jgi:hypothetical protein